jgi:DNA invertase Pin-like site-specific DNA recombinase
MTLGFSYIRFSTREQRKGDSLRRQLKATADWCQRNDVALDTSLTFHDLGRSAYLGEHRKNPDRNALAAFLKLVEDGKVPKGSFLIIESLDRLTREHVRAGLMLCLGLIEAGVRVVQLSPNELTYDETSDEMSLMLMIVELSRGHNESKRKSDTVGPAWREKKRRVVAGEAQKATERMGPDCPFLARRVPAWVKVEAGKLALVPEKAEVVRLIFRLSAAGYGDQRIVARLIKDGVPPLAGGAWARTYVGKVLRDGRAAGFYTPRGRGRRPEGEPVAGYFPACVSPEEWQAVCAERVQRQRTARGRCGGQVNVFAKMIRCALDGSSYYLTARVRHGRYYYVLSNLDSKEGRGRCRSFPYDVLETAVLSLLREVDPGEVCGTGGKPDRARVLAGQLEQVEESLRRLTADLDEHGETPTLLARVRDKDAQRARLKKELDAAQAEARRPLAVDWGTLQSLAALLAASPDPEDCRVRLRAVLRRTVADMRMLVVARGLTRLAAVQIFFKNDGHRTYLIRHQPAQANGKQRVEGHWHARSLKDAGLTEGDLDLRKPAAAARLAALLGEVDVAALSAAMG